VFDLVKPYSEVWEANMLCGCGQLIRPDGSAEACWRHTDNIIITTEMFRLLDKQRIGRSSTSFNHYFMSLAASYLDHGYVEAAARLINAQQKLIQAFANYRYLMCIHLTCSPMSIEQMNRWTDGQMDE
jgi:hypothetical protein